MSPYVITEYIRGPEGMEGDLRGWLGHPRLTLPVAVAMVLQIAQGMQHAVRKVPNLVHRDLKPANILVNGDGKAMVTDFGLVHATQSGAGTPAYMSPEQWRAETLDARNDIYAYGCILFEMFTAHRLFPALTEREWERAHLESSPVNLTRLVPELPDEIDQFVRRCLEQNPAVRPQNWDEIVAFFAEWYHRLTGKAVVLDFSSLALDAGEWVNASYSLGNLQRYDEMLIACDRALAIDPNYALAWKNKGVALNRLKRYDEAIQAYDRALAINPDDAKAWNSKAYVFEQIERYDEAIQANDRALAINPDDAEVWNDKASIFNQLKRYDEAIQAYDRALAINPEDANTWISKGILFDDLKRYGDEIQAYDRALAIDSGSCARDLKEEVLSSIERADEVIQAYDRALAIEPNNAGKWSDKGDTLNLLKRYDEAIQAYDRALAIDSSKANRWRFKGNALYKLNRFEEAIQAYDSALAIDQNDMLAWNSKGHALTGLKRYEESFNAYYRALTLDPNRSSAHENRANALQLSTLSVGSTVKGIVKNINSRGAFVNIGFTDGWLNITNIAWHRIKHPSEVLSVGDEVQAKILTFDQEKNGVGLGMKQLGEDPWVDIGRR